VGALSQVNTETLHPVRIEVPPCWTDHRIDGRSVLPAGEALQILARETLLHFSDFQVSESQNAIFSRFLPLPTDHSPIEAWVKFLIGPDGSITASLLTQKSSKSNKIRRWVEHVQVTFFHRPKASPLASWGYSREHPTQSFSISTEQLYRSLVPFGPAYHNVREPILLHPLGASSRITCLGDDTSISASHQPLGCPFVLDAAFHLACAWGQRNVGKVTFPTGYERRIVLEPTRPSKEYFCELVTSPVEQSPILFFNLLILSAEKKPCEVLRNVRMEDIFRGKQQAPEWIRRPL